MKKTQHHKHPKNRRGQVLKAVLATALAMFITVLLVTYCSPAKACSYDCGGHDSDVTHNTYNSYRSARTSEDVLKGALVGAALICQARAVADMIDQRSWRAWTWCGDYDAPQPTVSTPPAIPNAPVNDVTPDNLNDRTRTFTVRPVQ